MLSRRRFLRQTMGFSAALTLGGRGHSLLASPGTAPATTAPTAPLPPDAGVAAAHLLAVGDFGVKAKDLPRQRAVAEAMARYVASRQVRPQALALLGDNFYGGLAGKGVKSPRWDDNVERMYPPAAFDCPIYPMLGNHDYGDEKKQACVAAQLAYRKHRPASRWTMPGKWYRFELTAPGGAALASCLVIDTNCMIKPGTSRTGTKEEQKRQADWLDAELAKPRAAPWTFVLGHHPLYSDGLHGDDDALVAQLDPLFRARRVDLYLCGHDHDLQHLEFAGHPTSFVISGGGGARARPFLGGLRGPFGKAVYGFTHLDVRPHSFAVRHVDANGVLLHGFTKTRAGGVMVG